MKMALTFKDALHKAEEVARECSALQLTGPVDTILSGEFIETEYFWFFFQKSDLPFERGSSKDLASIGGISYEGAAFLVAKNDTDIRIAYDLRSEPEKMNKHIEDLKLHYSRVVANKS